MKKTLTMLAAACSLTMMLSASAFAAENLVSLWMRMWIRFIPQIFPRPWR